MAPTHNIEEMDIYYDNEIIEFSLEEVDRVNGGWLWLAVSIVRCVASSTCRTDVGVVTLAVAGAAAAYVGYENNRVD